MSLHRTYPYTLKTGPEPKPHKVDQERYGNFSRLPSLNGTAVWGFEEEAGMHLFYHDYKEHIREGV